MKETKKDSSTTDSAEPGRRIPVEEFSAEQLGADHPLVRPLTEEEQRRIEEKDEQEKREAEIQVEERRQIERIRTSVEEAQRRGGLPPLLSTVPEAKTGGASRVKRRKHSQLSEVFAEIRDREEFFGRHGFGWRLPGEGLSYAFLSRRPITPTAAFLFRRFTSFYDAMREWRVQVPPSDTDVSALGSDARKAMERAKETVPLRREAADQILAALDEPTERSRKVCEDPELVARMFGGSREECLAAVKSRRDNYGAAVVAIEFFCAEAKGQAGEDPTQPVKWRWPKAEGGNPLDKSPRLRVAWELENDIRPLLEAYRDPARFFREIAPREWPFSFAEKEIGPFENFAEIGVLGVCPSNHL